MMPRTRRLLLYILINAILFAAIGFLLNWIPFLQASEVKTWHDAGTVLLSHAITGALFGIVWYFLQPLIATKRPPKTPDTKH